MNGCMLPDGRMLIVDPLMEKEYGDQKGAHAVLSEREKKNTDDVAIIRYLYLAQGFTFEDMAFVMGDGITPEILHNIFLRQKTRLPVQGDHISRLCKKLGVPQYMLLLHARSWLEMSPDRKELPFAIPILSETGEATDEKMWFSVKWLADRFNSLKDVSIFKVEDNRLHDQNINAGDIVFVLRTEKSKIFQQSGIYLIKGYDDLARLRQATITMQDENPGRYFVIPGLPEVTLRAEDVKPENNLGKVVYKFAQYA